MALVDKVGKMVGRRGVAIAAAAGVGIAGFQSNLIEGDKDTYGMQQALLEGVLGDPYADQTITGGRMNLLGTMFNPLAGILPGDATRLKAFQHINSQSFDNWKADKQGDRYRFNHNEVSGQLDFYNAGERIQGIVSSAIDAGGYEYPAISPTGRRPYTTNEGQNMGQLVFGAYNTRHGR